MQNYLCLLADEAAINWDLIVPALARCGLNVWIASSPEACLSDSRSNDTLLLIVDMPLEKADACLKTLRTLKFTAPALLVANERDAELCAANPDWLDVLKKPVSLRILLGWVECVCAAYIALQRANSLRRSISRAA